jgi:hypothetical protein
MDRALPSAAADGRRGRAVGLRFDVAMRVEPHAKVRAGAQRHAQRPEAASRSEALVQRAARAQSSVVLARRVPQARPFAAVGRTSRRGQAPVSRRPPEDA